MKKVVFASLLIISGFVLQAQDDISIIKANVDANEAASHIWFLASDELRGRDTGSPEIDIAAAYIAAQYRKYGVQPIEESYFQQVELEMVNPPEKGSLALEEGVFEQGKELIVMAGSALTAESKVVYVGFGQPEDLTRKAIEGKIVIAKAGYTADDTPRQYFNLSKEKRQNARENGAIALVELYNSPSLPWQRLVQYLSGPRLGFAGADDEDEEETLTNIWINDDGGALAEKYAKLKKTKGFINITEKRRSNVPAKNVIGVIIGSDPVLKNEYVLLSAHYDHIGIKQGTNGEDSIYNGARDNAIGVAGVLAAAQGLQKNPVKRSVLFLACTGEEKGLLGSQWFAEHSPIPLNKIVFNLNIDGGGYNDVNKISVMGLTRTTAEREIRASIEAFGLEPLADPAPEQNLFDRSDNVSFAAKGIPAPTFSTGFTSFDEEIMKYYHQVSDEAESLDFDYLAKYFYSYALLVRKIANMAETPYWIKGDKYEEVAKKLYGID